MTDREQWWYVSSPRLTCAVAVRDGYVTDAAPIARRFIGQRATNLGRWLRSHGETIFAPLAEGEGAST